MIGIVAYGLGNVCAIRNIYDRLGLPAKVITSPDDDSSVNGLVLPGVGAFDWAMAELNNSGLRSGLEKLVQEDNKPILGICVGMQMLAASSEEGQSDGLNWIPGVVRKLNPKPSKFCSRLPHMGWNDVKPRGNDRLFSGLNSGAHFYFLHSYYFDADNDCDVLASTDYGTTLTCAVNSGNIYGVQFHPEKSHSWGIQLLKNFADVSQC